MMRSKTVCLAAVAVVVLLATTAARADKPNIPVEKTPKVVLDACTARYPGAKITKVEVFEDRSGYSLEIKFEGYRVETDFTNDGMFLYAETTIPYVDMPKDVVRALKKKFRGRRLGTFELCHMADGTEIYEIEAKYVRALGAAGPEAKDALPILEKSEDCDSRTVQHASRFARWLIETPETAVARITKSLDSKDVHERYEAVEALKYQGAKAAAAPPVLREMAKPRKENPQGDGRVSSAIKQIEKAVAKTGASADGGDAP